ncbi:hypothetical protein DYL61_14145 [Pseudomonas nabeulensis]|uniref:Uncharacterized protein n=1 Tax=Pseudomonas nabeulensis TaxID=2293833 RepID=A0A4Z0B4E2_9PSED|nr:hypothetical protein DYL61_14145 [Pseudomonas nabeulensis]
MRACGKPQRRAQPLWRGSLLPLGCVAAPNLGSAAHSSGSKLPRHSEAYFLKRSVSASATAGCTNLVISPPKAAISRTNVEEMNE